MNPSLPIPQKYTEYGTLQTKEEILNWLEANDRNYIKNLPNYEIGEGATYGFTNQKGFSVELKGSIDISNKGLTNIPVKFIFVDGDFNCSGNNLDNFINSPMKYQAHLIVKKMELET